MKKYKSLSVGLAAAILISTFSMIQVSAAPDTNTENTDTESITSENSELSDPVETENIYISTAE